jgi:hypothetical protein
VGTKERGNEDEYGGCILYPYAEIVLRRGEEERGRTMEGINPTKIYFEHIHKHHNGYSCVAIIC